jgi:pimeloyl-ACP methyl ester carboxylesterase
VSDLAGGGYRVVAYDRRGYGRSVHPAIRDYRVHVADLAAVVEHVGAPAHVFGWSSGGNVALALAAARPELFRSVVVLEAPWHGLRGATPDMPAALAKAKLAQLRGRRREAAAQFFRWASGMKDGSNGYDRLPRAAQEERAGNTAVVLAELDPHPHGLMMEHIATRQLAQVGVPITWLLGGESRERYARCRRGYSARFPACGPSAFRRRPPRARRGAGGLRRGRAARTRHRPVLRKCRVPLSHRFTIRLRPDPRDSGV